MGKFPLGIANGSLKCEDLNENGTCESQRQFGDIWREIQGANNWKGMLHPIHPLLKAEILRYGDFAQQCYDAFDNTRSSKYYRNCKRTKSSLGKRLELVKCGRGYQVTEYIYANTGTLNSYFQEKARDSGAWMGFIAVCTDENEIKRLGRRDIVVAWRGTETPQEWIQNLRDILVPATLSINVESNIQATFKSDVRVEKGFLKYYTSVNEGSRLSAREIVVNEITRLLNNFKDEDVSITFTGHSLGAALATLSAYDIKQMVMNENYMRPIPVTVFAFASPRVGNLSFSQHVEEIGVKVLRLVNRKDFIPKVPGVFVNEKMGWLTRILYWFPWAYVHVGIEISLDTSNSTVLKQTYNPVGFHNLEVYLHLIDGLQENKKLPFTSSGRDRALVNKNSDLLVTKLQIPSYWWTRRNKEVVKRIDGKLVYSPRPATSVLLPQSSPPVIFNLVSLLQVVLVLSVVIIVFQIGRTI
ncbi:hypothetical protein SUGI_0894490 [Cryptomeria japonica]|uniref:phospholipase A1-Igamma2, chloroplastic-like n=1 Tax=Cryptomeria japonica TaxID=3369 RepID=UPI002414A399|nr:phospholipase A1-Igamma2, chloroplastic-like [Cryptomeria japonica]GLJ43103.1 hypothetical protein SUGI_0894490 [Cryptomeria japonica]